MASGPILVVDDEPSNLATLKQILGDEYQLVFARSGADCLAAAHKHRPSLILLDVQMPDMDGYTVCRGLKANPDTEATPVIFVTSLAQSGDEAAGFASGAVDYIVKPVSPAIVLARVRTHLSLVHATTLERYVQQLEVEQARSARMARTLAVLSSTNSMIVRVREPQELIDDSCEIAVEHGRFGMAWIGTREGNDTLVLAAIEIEDQDRDSTPAFLGAHVALEGLGLPEHVLKTGVAAYCNDTSTGFALGQCGADAHSRGYMAMVALPLSMGENKTGVMVLYAREENSFDDDEMKLLGELAGDISFALQAIEYQQRASFLSFYDALTTLPNTTLFLDRLDQLLSGARRDGSSAFVVTLDLERFKQLNDDFGRHVGDYLLKAVAKRLEEGLAGRCSVARIGSNNFAIAASGEIAAAMCEQILAMVTTPITLEGDSITLSARLGVAVFPADADNAEALFKNAELALKQSKATKTNYLFYSPALNARLAEKATMEKMLRRGLEEQQFELHYQPKLDLQSGRISGAEALIRWHHPERGMVPPIEFIPLAEETGLIVAIGEWVVRAVCAQQARWLQDGVAAVPVALNLSPMQFREGNIQRLMLSALEENKLDARWVELELTETLVMHDPEDAEVTMRALRSKGLLLSLDDFGTGYSSLAYLKRFPFDTVKIDRAFIVDVTQNPDDAAIATAIIAMAHSLRMKVVAEGVETEAQLHFLRTRHCDQMQGYYFSKPVPASDFAAMLTAGKSLNLASSTSAAAQSLLIVEEDAMTMSALQRSLRAQGYHILCANDGRAGLELLAMHPVQVIVCSQRMAKTTGDDFLTVVAKMYPDTMRIVLSGYTELQSVIDVINRGEVYRFLTKPWDDDLLRENIKEAFRRHRPGG
jgi:diguanylate cyclase (GGDEF)-like protein